MHGLEVLKGAMARGEARLRQQLARGYRCRLTAQNVERIWLYLRERFIFSLDDCAERPVEKPAGQHKVGELGRSVLANQPGFGKISRHAVK